MNIEYYERSNGRCPVQEFIRDLPATERVRVMNAIERLQEHGLALERPSLPHCVMVFANCGSRHYMGSTAFCTSSAIAIPPCCCTQSRRKAIKWQIQR